MSEFVDNPCSCGGTVIAVSPDEDDIRLAVAAHNETPRHQEWRAVQEATSWRRKKGPCICRGGEPRNVA